MLHLQNRDHTVEMWSKYNKGNEGEVFKLSPSSDQEMMQRYTRKLTSEQSNVRTNQTHIWQTLNLSMY